MHAHGQTVEADVFVPAHGGGRFHGNSVAHSRGKHGFFVFLRLFVEELLRRHAYYPHAVAFFFQDFGAFQSEMHFAARSDKDEIKRVDFFFNT